MNDSNAERLASIRRRIAVIREALEDPTLITNLAIDGVSETFDRAALRAELKELEFEERQTTGDFQRVFSVGLKRF